MARKRRSVNPSFKAKIALEAIKGVKTIAEIAKKHKLHPTQINLRKKQLLEGAEEVFLDGKPKAKSDGPKNEVHFINQSEFLLLLARSQMNSARIPTRLIKSSW